MKFSSREEVEKHFEGEASPEAVKIMADRLITFATKCKLDYGEDWGDAWEILIGGDDDGYKDFIDDCEAASFTEAEPVSLSSVGHSLREGDVLKYRNSFGQEFEGTVTKVADGYLFIRREEWIRAGFGEEILKFLDNYKIIEVKRVYKETQ